MNPKAVVDRKVRPTASGVVNGQRWSAGGVIGCFTIRLTALFSPSRMKTGVCRCVDLRFNCVDLLQSDQPLAIAGAATVG